MNTTTKSISIVLVFVTAFVAISYCMPGPEPDYDSNIGVQGQRFGRGRYGLSNYNARYGSLGGYGRLARGYGGMGYGQGMNNRYGLYNRYRYGQNGMGMGGAGNYGNNMGSRYGGGGGGGMGGGMGGAGPDDSMVDQEQ